MNRLRIVGLLSPIAGEYHSIDKIYRFLRRVKNLTAGESIVEPEIVLVNDRPVMVYVHVSATRDGKVFDNYNA